MGAFQFFLRRFFGYLFTFLGTLVGLGAMGAMGLVGVLWYQETPLSERMRAILWPLGPVIFLLGAGIFAAGRYLLRRRAGEVESAFSRAAGARRSNGLTSQISNTFVWPLAAGLWFVVRDHPATTPAAPPWVVVAGALAVYAGFQGIIACHELGHLGMAAILGLELHVIQVGTGPRWFSRRFGGLLVEYGAWLGGGIVRAVDTEERGWRRRHWLFIAGGPVVHGLVMFALGWWLWRHVGAPRHLGWRWLTLAWQGDAPAFFALWVLLLGSWSWVFAVLPRAARFDAIQARTDGYWLLCLPRLPQNAVRAWVKRALAQSAQAYWSRGEHARAWDRACLLAARYPDSPTGMALEGDFLVDEKRYAEAAASYDRALQPREGAPPIPLAVRHALRSARIAALLQAGEAGAAREACAQALAEATNPAERAEALDTLASTALLPEARALLPEAEAWAREAVELDPEAITRFCTLGAVLADLGHFDEAEPILRRVWKESRRDLDALLSAFALGLVARGRGQADEWRRWRERAEAFTAIAPAWLNGRVASELKDE